MTIHPVLTQQLVDDRRRDLLASARSVDHVRTTRRARRARRSAQGRRA